MERERQIHQPATGSGGGPAPGGEDLEQIRASGQGMLEAADRVLDAIPAENAEDYLRRNRQRGGQ